jgi:arsenite oxidase small subunit
MTTQTTEPRACMSRRDLLILGGSTVTVVGALSLGGPAMAQSPQLVMSTYSPKPIGSLSDLRQGEAVSFTYPTDDIENLLVMLGEEAGAGIGPERNVVAFNTICPHMGGYMDAGTFRPEHSVLGPCPLHLSTFDLTKHGMIVSGHSTASLPQIALALEGDDIVATGVMGLFFGYSSNPSGA